MEDLETRKMTKVLRVKYTKDQLLHLGDSMANAIRNRQVAQDELKSIRASYDSKIKAAEAEIDMFATAINSGWEMKSVECEEIKDFRTFTVLTSRLDTGETIEERAMTAEERQTTLPLHTDSEPEGEGGDSEDTKELPIA